MVTRVPPEMLESPGEDVSLLAVMPIGAVIAFAGSAAPNPTPDATFLLCYGQTVSRADYATLFDRLGTAYGAGNGTTTFALPDLRGRVAVGKDDMGGAAAGRMTVGVSGIAGATLGAAGGDQRLHNHTHGVTDPGHDHAINGANSIGADTSGMSAGVGPFSGNTSSATTGISIQSAGAGSAQNVQPSLVLNYLIRAL